MNRNGILSLFTKWAAVVVLPVFPASAAPVITVGNGCSYPTIAAGIAAAGPGGTVLIEGGRTFEEHLVINKGLTLRGGYSGCASDSNEPTVIDGKHSGRVVDIEGGLEVHLENLWIHAGSTAGQGAGIRFAVSGGGLLVLDTVSIRFCTADSAGGGAYVGPNAELSGTGVEFYYNNASHGAAIALYGGRASLNNSSLIFNSADKGGAVAGIEAFGFTPELSLADGSEIRGNQALTGDGLGGGIYLEDGEAVLDPDTLVEGNRAIEGGGVYLAAGVLRGAGNFFDNSADAVGGAVYATGSTVDLVDGPLFSTNDARVGGAACLTDSSVLRIRDGAVRSNTAIDEGGAFYVQEMSTLEISRTSFACRWSGCHELTDNTAGSAGGAISARFSSTVHLEGQLLENNSAGFAGAVHVTDESAVTATGCVFTGNDANSGSNAGDAVYISKGSSFTGTGVTLAYNDDVGGAGGQAIHLSHNISPALLVLDAAIIWGHGLSINDPDQSVTCSDIEGGYAGAGNISVDPQFISPPTSDFHLEPTSPLIDRCAGLGEWSGDWDWEVRPWVIDDPATPFDMGADEVDSVPVGIFADGFESDDTTAWSNTLP